MTYVSSSNRTSIKLLSILETNRLSSDGGLASGDKGQYFLASSVASTYLEKGYAGQNFSLQKKTFKHNRKV